MCSVTQRNGRPTLSGLGYSPIQRNRERERKKHKFSADPYTRSREKKAIETRRRGIQNLLINND